MRDDLQHMRDKATDLELKMDRVRVRLNLFVCVACV